MTSILKFEDADYIRFDPCEGDEAQTSCRTVKLVKARKDHKCFLGSHPYGDNHMIYAGEFYRYERALVDGDYWGEYRVCVSCMDKWLEDIGRPRR